MKIVTKKQILRINGKDYSSLKEVPEHIRQYIDKDNNGKLDLLEEFEKHPFKKSQSLSIGHYKNPNDEYVKSKYIDSTSSIQSNDRGAIVRLVLAILAIGIYLFYSKYSK